MVRILRKCNRCNLYTIKTDKCPNCGENVHVPHPAKFSTEDKYAKLKSKMRRINE